MSQPIVAGQDPDTGKKVAAAAILPLIPRDAVLGIGTGRTINCLIALLAQRPDLSTPMVSSSETTTQQLQAAGIPLCDLNSVGTLDLYIDGADEVAPPGYLIKGGGGALTREKIMAAASREFWCVVDTTKQVPRLGAFPVPVEVIPMARSWVAREMLRLGGKPHYRSGFVTDNGHMILDVHGLDLTDPPRMEALITAIPGVVTVGIFATHIPHRLWVGAADGTVTTHTYRRLVR